MSNRIKSEIVSINQEEVHDLYDGRAKARKLKHKYNYVLLHDDDTELVISRDKYEKDKVENKLQFSEDDIVLDIGCGIGRWGETVLKYNCKYIGIDYSKNLLEIAKDNLSEFDNYRLLNASFQGLSEAINELDRSLKFSKIIICGVMMYINEDTLIKCIEDLYPFCQDECTVYIKESVASEERVTLRSVFAEKINHNYSVIYRTIREYKSILKLLTDSENPFKIYEEGDMYPQNLQNNGETKVYYFILKR